MSGGQPGAPRGILSVDHDEIRSQSGSQGAQPVGHRRAARPAHHIAEKKESHETVLGLPSRLGKHGSTLSARGLFQVIRFPARKCALGNAPENPTFSLLQSTVKLPQGLRAEHSYSDARDHVNPGDFYNQIAVPSLSIYVLGLMLLVALPATAVIGFVTGRNRRKARIAAGKSVDLVTGETTLAAILALLGLLLAFSFGNALSVAQERKGALFDEAAAIGTAFLRADFVADPSRTELQKALLAYAKTRVISPDTRMETLDDVQEFIDRSIAAQSKLWPLTLEATADPLPPPLKTFLAGSVNEVLDLHLDRVKTLSNPVSEFTQGMVLALAMTALFLLGNRAGFVGRDLTWRTFVFSGFLLVVIFTIVDTQRPVEGFVLTDAAAMNATIFDMEQALAGRL